MSQLIMAVLFAIASASTGQRTISMTIPDGWRQVDIDEVRKLRPKVVPQNELQRRADESPDPNLPILIMKHDTKHGTGKGMASSVQVVVTTVPPKLRGASSIETGRVVAAMLFAQYGSGKYEIEPREITVGGMPAAEWVMQYKLVESIAGEHAMVSRTILIVDGARIYMIGYTAPAEAADDLKAFDDVVRSVTFSKP
jgi:hypothetical protein